MIFLELNLGAFSSIFTKGFISISNGVSKLTKLTKLHLTLDNKNYVNKEGGIAFGQALKNLINITDLSLIFGSNYLCDEGAISIG